jgi:hypothetical protein
MNGLVFMRGIMKGGVDIYGVIIKKVVAEEKGLFQ